MNNITISLIYLITSCLILIIGKWLYLKFLKYDMYKEIRSENPMGIIPYCGFLLGNCAILAGAFIGPDTQKAFWCEYGYYIFYAFLGIFLMLFSGFIVEKAILHKFNNVLEITRDRNLGTAAVYFGIYLACGLIISACVYGETLNPNGKLYELIATLSYYFLGMIFLIIFAKIHNKLTPYSLLKEIENDNASVGISLAGHIIAIGIILMKASIGDMGEIAQNIRTYAVDLCAILLLLPFVRIILDRIISKNINIAREIKNNNIAAGLGEAFVIVCFAILIFFMVDFTSII
ncbi:MAG: DUF350 domain-containing protein [Candidatus Gastranaerophilales bacterium]|nr:DUF350 domain-containing protein [Candidatus Gastranaerophilales bacterium]